MRYISGEREPGCVFCNALRAGNDVDALILYRGRRNFVILNLFPYNSGHAMIVPYDHVATLEALDGETRAEQFELATLFVEAARAVLRCDGFNLGLNIGEVAGAGVAEHLHLHAVPRWLGDANFMPILAGTTVMPELLPVTYARLRAEIERIVAQRERGARAQAGALVVLPGEGRVALRRAANDDIVVPKGHIEAAETAAEAAVREVREETGLDAVIAGWAGSLEFELSDTRDDRARRHVAYFVATGTRTPESALHIGHDTLLFPIDAAAEAVQIPELHQLVRDATPAMRRLAGQDA
jgi:ATP adenylyltransferase